MTTTIRTRVATGLAAVVVLGGSAGIAIAQRAGATPGAPSATPTSTATATGTATPTAAGKHHGAGRAVLGRLEDLQHGEWVSKGPGNAYVTHDAIHGTVTAVSSSSITVRSADGTSMTFAVDATTKVYGRKGAKGAPAPAASIADVKTGQAVLVSGVKSPGLVAKAILLRKA